MLDGGAFTTGLGADQNLVGGSKMKPFDFVFVRLLIHIVRGMGIMLLTMCAGLMLPLWWQDKTFFDFVKLWGKLSQTEIGLAIVGVFSFFLYSVFISFLIENLSQGIWSLSFPKRCRNNGTTIENTMSEVKK